MLTIGKDPETWLVRRVLEQRAAERPDHPVMHWEGQDYTYAAINREANRIADRCPDLGTFIVAGDDLEDARRTLTEETLLRHCAAEMPYALHRVQGRPAAHAHAEGAQGGAARRRHHRRDLGPRGGRVQGDP